MSKCYFFVLEKEGEGYDVKCHFQKESLNIDSKQFYQYQQNEQLPLTAKRPIPYEVRNHGPG